MCEEKKEIKGDCPEIEVRAKLMKADYKLYVPFVLRWEGGLANDKDDKGGLTNKGITYATYQSLCNSVYGCYPSMNHFMNLDSDSVGLMIKYYWDKSTYNNNIESQKVAEAITSWMWGSGYNGIAWFQEMLNKEFGFKLAIDGSIGKLTINAINSINEDELFRMCLKYRRQKFIDITIADPSQKKFLKGWLNRLRDFAQRHGELEYFNSINV